MLPIVDHEDLLNILHYDPDTGVFTWKVRRGRMAYPGAPAGALCPDGYSQIGIQGKRYMLHRIAWFYATGQWPENEIDHINGNRGDNRICNLRPATVWENNRNAKIRKDNTTGVKGVGMRGGRYMARIKLNGIRKLIGMFATLDEARDAIVLARNALHQDFAKHH